ncbi:hypothetical protein BLA23254_07745 [Burkholderia lata]|uniref:Uncharacterized protein n=1 Tax=Burkholderia lata (strain ATCC 17760 / DSM 23089 / LMG 22485 / NCIMB 9086 / R18194 / 383) TaxID=482957 RepID=A0A6P2T2Q5_BURL3|nr:hypothetical protein [Burkholderia lata]VWC50228.1 hypothetical protein BLA23254_07745 [Burkholderia lata]
MNKAMLSLCGLVIGGLVVTLVIVLETVPTPQAKIMQAAAKQVKAK